MRQIFCLDWTQKARTIKEKGIVNQISSKLKISIKSMLKKYIEKSQTERKQSQNIDLITTVKRKNYQENKRLRLSLAILNNVRSFLNSINIVEVLEYRDTQEKQGQFLGNNYPLRYNYFRITETEPSLQLDFNK